MKRFTFGLCWLLLILGISAHAQTQFIDLALKRIDTLISFQRYELAQNKLDTLKNLLNRNPDLERTKEFDVRIRYARAKLLDDQNQSPAKIIPLYLALIDEAEQLAIPRLTFSLYLSLALSYEKAENLSSNLAFTKRYLDKAYAVYKSHQLSDMYSAYCIRLASYYRFSNQPDSLRYYALKANEYALKYNKGLELEGVYLLLSIDAHNRKDYQSLLQLHQKTLALNKKHNYNVGVAYMNMATAYYYLTDYKRALMYLDSANIYRSDFSLLTKLPLTLRTSLVYEKLGQLDSALHYHKSYLNYRNEWQNEVNATQLKELEEKYQNDKKEIAIKNRERLLFLAVGVLLLIFIAWILVLVKNKKIKAQNQIINKQLEELANSLAQKQVLLSELQHRVKNNLQHIIGILELQKDSIQHNTLEDVIRENQNRIHSMALLHQKLSVQEDVNEVDVVKYISELSALVVDTYEHNGKHVEVMVAGNLKTLSIQKTLPLGLLLTELLSNSMKHAFVDRPEGTISIRLNKSQSKVELTYTDNGVGYDFQKQVETGLGIEIIKGLAGQLKAEVLSVDGPGFELKISFNP